MPFEVGEVARYFDNLELRRVLNDTSIHPQVRMTLRERLCLYYRRRFESMSKWEPASPRVNFDEEGDAEFVTGWMVSSAVMALLSDAQAMGCEWTETAWEEIMAEEPKVLREIVKLTE